MSERTPCDHWWILLERDENENRIRVWEECARCPKHRFGVYAKRLDEKGRMLWGPPGVWNYDEEPDRTRRNIAKAIADAFVDAIIGSR